MVTPQMMQGLIANQSLFEELISLRIPVIDEVIWQGPEDTKKNGFNSDH